MTKKLPIIFLLALVARLTIVYFQYSGDIRNHLAWGQSIISSGSFGFYARHFPGFNDANYPPVAILFFALAIFLYHLVLATINYLNQLIDFFPSFLVPLFQTENMQAAFLKLPAIFADLGVGYLIYKLTRNKLLTFLYLFNPAVIYVSTVWGQIESLPIFFLLLSFYFLPCRYFISHLAFVAAVLTKQTALWLLPVFLILWFKKASLNLFLRGLTLQVVVFVLIYLPFALPLDSFSLYLSSLVGSSTLISDQAGNLWYWLFAGARLSDNQPFLFLTVRLWSLFLLGISYTVVCLSLWRKSSLENTAKGLFWLSLFAFFLQTRVHDRHLAPALPFLLITPWPNSKKIPIYLILSGYHLINLYLALRLPFI